MFDIESNSDNSRFNSICKDANKYEGSDNCAYNLGLAFSQAYTQLSENLSKNPKEW